MDETSDLVAKIQGMAETRQGEELTPAGPDDPSASPGGDPKEGLVTLEFTEKSINDWWKEIERARSRRKSREESWDILLDEYMPVVSKSGVAETVKVQAHFRNVHTRMGNLFYRSPDVIMELDDPGPGNNVLPMAPPMPGQPPQRMKTMADVVAVKQAVLKKTMGRDGLKANRLMDELLFDVLAWAGLGVCKFGYLATFKNVNQPKMMPAPAMEGAPGSMLGLSAPPQVPVLDPVTQQPVMEPVSMVVHEKYYATRISMKKALWDSSLRSTRFKEMAAWVGHEFFITPKRAIKEYWLTEEEANKISQDDLTHKFPGEDNTQTVGLVRCVEIFCRAAVYTDEPHPEAVCQLTLVEGIKDRPVVWRPSPDQEFDPNTGDLTQDSLREFPILFLSIRDLAESCFPPSDSAFTNSDIKQMSTYRRQTIRLRDAAIGKYLYDPDAFDEGDVDKLKNGDIGDFIPVQSNKLAGGGEKIFTATARIQAGSDDQRGFMGIKQDMNETLGVGSNQSGVETDTVRTATEADKVASAMQARNDKELSRVVDFYLDLVRGIDSLIMRYMTKTQYVQIAGDEAAPIMQPWNGKMITGKYLYDIAPDSQLRPDTARERAEALQYYNVTAKDPLSNRMYVLRRMARMWGMDPNKATTPPPPPAPKQPDPVRFTLNIGVQDLDNPKVVTLIQALGASPGGIDTTAAISGQPEHGGPNEHADVISKHMMSNSGGKENAPGAHDHRAAEVK